MWSMVTLTQTSLGRHCCVLLIAVWNLVALILLIRSLVTGQATAGGQLLGAAAGWTYSHAVSGASLCSAGRNADGRRCRVHEAAPTLAPALQS